MIRLGRRASLLAAFYVLASAGCTRSVWTKAAFTEEEFRADDYSCERDMRQSGYFGTGWVGALNAKGFYERCMQAKGYRKVRESDLANESCTPARTCTSPSPQPQPADVQCPGNAFWNGYGCTAR